MRVAYEYSHLGGKEILQVRFPEILREIREVIAEVKAERAKVSKEKTKEGTLLYAPERMNDAFTEAFAGRVRIYV
jgi:hypothetical protein